MKANVFVILAISCGLTYVLCKEGVSYKLQRTLCKKFNPKFMHNVTCRTRHINRTTQLVNFDSYIKPNVSLADIRVRIMTYKRFLTVYRPTLINYSENVCDALSGSITSHYLNVLKEQYLKYSNLMEPCPKSGRMYIKDMIFYSNKFPQFVPVGEYRLDLDYFTFESGKEEPLFMVQDFIEVKPLGALQF